MLRYMKKFLIKFIFLVVCAACKEGCAYDEHILYDGKASYYHYPCVMQYYVGRLSELEPDKVSYFYIVYLGMGTLLKTIISDRVFKTTGSKTARMVYDAMVTAGIVDNVVDNFSDTE